MPGLNRTGPMGQGPGTGQGLGRCPTDRPDAGETVGETRLVQRARRRRCRRGDGSRIDDGRWARIGGRGRSRAGGSMTRI